MGSFLTVTKGFLYKLAAVLGVLVLVTTQQAIAFSPNDFACAKQGGTGGTCFYDPTACTGAGSVAASSTPSGPASPSGSLVWPFATKSSSQYQRVDEGWDIQDKPSADVYAIAPGTLHIYNADFGNFGNDYPTEELDQDIGGPSKFVYYGHVHILNGLNGKHVDAGQKIAITNGPGATVNNPQNGSGADPGWLEIGFAQPGTDAPVDSGSGVTSAGQKMHDLLIDAQPGSGGSLTTSTPDTSSCACTASASDTTGALVGKNNEDKIWNYFKGKGLSDEQTAGVMGNIDDESGFNPEAVQGGGNSKSQPKGGGADGWGLAQWSYDPSSGANDVAKLVQQYHVSGSIYELQTQLDLIWAQMNGTSPTGVDHMIGQFKHINDVTQAATYFSGNFEGGIPGSRVSDALTIYGQYKGKSATATPPGGSVGGPVVTTSDTLNGHKLPATVGGTGLESFFSSYALGTPANQNEDNYYITMRWRYDKWNWDGTSVPGPETNNFYLNHPKVLVTNPRNHKSIIAIALESGPAPWTGVDSGSNNVPKQGWANPQDGTPPQYKGRVSGFPPPATQALGAIQTTPGTGDKLEYAWAPDQNAKPGPTNLSVDNISGSSCATTGSANNDAIVQIAKQELALGLQGTGPLNDSGPVCKYQGSACGQPWCADFVSWVYKAAGTPFTGGADGGWRLATASDVTGYFLQRKGQTGIGYGTPSGGDKMEPGWVVSFAGIPGQQNARGIGHVGIVTAVNSNGTFDDIEGNGAGAGVSENKNLSITNGVGVARAIDWGGYK